MTLLSVPGFRFLATSRVLTMARSLMMARFLFVIPIRLRIVVAVFGFLALAMLTSSLLLVMMSNYLEIPNRSMAFVCAFSKALLMMCSLVSSTLLLPPGGMDGGRGSLPMAYRSLVLMVVIKFLDLLYASYVASMTASKLLASFMSLIMVLRLMASSAPLVAVPAVLGVLVSATQMMSTRVLVL